MSFEVGGDVGLDFEGGLRTAVGSTIMNVVGSLPDEALDRVVARRHRNAYHFRQLGVGHEIRREVGQGTEPQLHDPLDVRLSQRPVGLNLSEPAIHRRPRDLGSDRRCKSLDELLEVGTLDLARKHR